MTRLHQRRCELLLRRELLRLRSAELRLAMAVQSAVLEPPLAQADQMLAGLRWLRRNPEWPLAGGALLLVLRPRRALRWGGLLWSAWRLLNRGGRVLRTLSAPRREGGV